MREPPTTTSRRWGTAPTTTCWPSWPPSTVAAVRKAVGWVTVASVSAVLACLAVPSEARSRAAGDTGVRDASGGTSGAQTEQTIAVDPVNPNNVLIGSLNGVSVSHDGGRTWEHALLSC